MTALCGLSNCDALRLQHRGLGGRSCMFLSRPKSLSDTYVQNRVVIAALRWRVSAFKAADGAVDTQEHDFGEGGVARLASLMRGGTSVRSVLRVASWVIATG